MKEITEEELRILRKQDWSEKELEDGTIVKNSFMQNLIKKNINEINKDLELRTAAIKSLNNLEKKKIIPSEDLLKILNNPHLFNVITEREFNKRIEGEEPTKKAIFLSLSSIWVEGSEIPLNTLVSSESSAGKSFICKNIIKIFPKEYVEYRTKITPEAFTYWHHNDPEWNWDGKICYLEDASQSILDGATFKAMCSEGSTATIVIKQKAVNIEINGKPVMLITTARTNPSNEILNRFQIVPLNESKEQTKAIVFRQARQKNDEFYDEGIINSLRFLKRKPVIIPFAEKIAQFLFDNHDFENLRLRRDFSRLLDLIKCSAVLHQYQREENEKREIIAEKKDYEIARGVINYIQTQTFRGLTHRLKKAFDYCKELKRFTAKEIHSKFPFVNQKMWYLYLDRLLERKMLNSELIKTDEAKQKITYYSVNEDKSFTLPEFRFLPESITNVTNITKDNEKNRTIVTNVTNVLEKPTKKQEDLDFSELEEVFKNE